MVLSEFRGNFTMRRTPTKRTDDEDEETIHPDLNEFLYELQGHRCNGCGYESRLCDLQSDHLEPVSKAPEKKYVESNRNLLCADCNRRKSNKYTLTQLRDILRDENEIVFDMRPLDAKRAPAFEARREERRKRRQNQGVG